MNSFEEQTLRLKQALGVAEDQQVAQALGLTKAAFAERKRRNAFPEAKLFDLMARRPDLNIDGLYVLTGDRTEVTSSERHLLNKVAEFTGKVNADPADLERMAALASEGMRAVAAVATRRQTDYRTLQALLNGVDDETFALIKDLVLRLSRDNASRPPATPAAPAADQVDQAEIARRATAIAIGMKVKKAREKPED